MNSITRSLLTVVVVCAVLLAGVAAPVSATATDTADRTDTTDRDGEARTVIATPGQPSDRGGDGTTDVTGEIILEEDRDTGTPTVSGTISITVTVPEQAQVTLPNGRRIIREVGGKK